MKNLRLQLLVSHLLALVIMLVVMVGAVYSFFHLGMSIERIVKDNYQSVEAVQNMKEALERMDSAATFHLAGEPARAREQYRVHARRFREAHAAQANNITEHGEQELSDRLDGLFATYATDMRRFLSADPTAAPAAARSRYVNALEPAFETLKDHAQRILALNQSAILRANARAKAEAQRASWVAVVATLGAFVVAILVAVRMVGIALSPLPVLARQAEEIGSGKLDQQIATGRSDEVGVLAGALSRMAEQLRHARDVEERRLHLAERMSDQALQSLYDPVIVTDSVGKVVHLNRAAEELFGAAEISKGADAAEVVRDPRIARSILQAISDRRITAAEDDAGLVTLESAGARRVYRLRATPMCDDDGALLGAVAALDDITHLRELDRLKSEFIGVASHELRTPLTSLQLSVQILEEGAAGPLTETQKEVVAAQSVDLKRLDRLTRDLLDITRLESGRMPPRLEPVELDGIVRAALDAVAGQAAQKGVRLETEASSGAETLLADRSQLTRALVNLLGNAVRHTPASGSVTVRTSRHPSPERLATGQTVAAHDDARSAGAQHPSPERLATGQIVIEVADTGCGIPADYLPRIFDRFVQAPGTGHGGAGLGLAIARTIARAHGGDILAVSRVGIGSTFTIVLPSAPAGVTGDNVGPLLAAADGGA